MERDPSVLLAFVLFVAVLLALAVAILRTIGAAPLFDDRHLNHQPTYDHHDHYDHEERETRSGVIAMSDSNRDRPEHLDRDNDDDCRGEARPPGRRNRDREPRERKRRQRPTPRPQPKPPVVNRKCAKCGELKPDVRWDRWNARNLCVDCWAAFPTAYNNGPDDGMEIVEEKTEEARRERRAQGGNG